MELRHLRDFVAVADELSFTRAAKKLHVAQPSLTQQIKLLEQELGVRLLNRIKGRVSLTEAGKVFLADSRRVIALSEDSVRAVQHFNRSETKQLKIGYVASLHYHLLPATLAAFQRAYPEVALNLFDMTCAQQLEALDADKIDLGFIGLRESLAGTNLQAEAVAFYEILVALPKGHPLSKKPKINLKELESHFFVGMSERNYPGWGEWMRRVVSRGRLYASNAARGRWTARGARVRRGGSGSRAATGASQIARASRRCLPPSAASRQGRVLHRLED